MKRALIIFVKNPQRGKVKTRLAKDIGELNALTIYHYLLEHTRKVTTQVQAERLLFYDQAISVEDHWSSASFQKLVQKGNDLGLRMLHAFQTAFTQGHTRVMIIGSDCIELTSDLIERAYIQLEDHDFVIGPAKDGGYYLLGMKYPEVTIFENKHWSTATVCNDTLNTIKYLSKTVHILPVISDIDTVSDLNDELRHLIALP